MRTKRLTDLRNQQALFLAPLFYTKDFYCVSRVFHLDGCTPLGKASTAVSLSLPSGASSYKTRTKFRERDYHLGSLNHQNQQISGNGHQKASDLMPLFFAQEAHKAVGPWDLGEEMLLGKASVGLSRSRLIENHSQHIKARRTCRQCTNLRKASVPEGQCAELNNTNCGVSYTSIGAPASNRS